MAEVFKDVTVYVSPTSKSKLISWELDRRFVPTSGQFTFYVESGYAAGSWTRLNPTSPVIDQSYYTDATTNKYGLINNIYYRVILVDGDSEYISTPQSVTGVLTLRESAILRNLLRQQYLRLTNLHAGVQGWLLRRRHWGTRCTVCTDFDLENQVSNPNCTTCYGTGIVYGYYNAYPFWMEFVGGMQSQIEMKSPTGVEDNIIRQGRCIAYPIISSYDIWVADDTDTRYIIRTVKTVAELKERPVIYTISLHEIPAGQIEYSVPLQASSSSSSGAAETDASWRAANDDFLER